MLTHGGHDLLHGGNVMRAGEILYLALAEAVTDAIDVHRTNVGIFRIQPGGRRIAWSAENKFDAMGGENFDGAVHPGKIELAFRRFEGGPCAFAGFDEVNACGLHHFGIFFPHGLGPVVRVVVGAV